MAPMLFGMLTEKADRPGSGRPPGDWRHRKGIVGFPLFVLMLT